MTRLGRKPQGAALVALFAGSAHAKQRMTLFLQTLSGQCTVGQACAELGIGESRFFAQRSDWLQEALELLEPRSPGRPAKAEPLPTPAQLESLRQRIRELEARAAVAEVKAELAGALPHVIRPPAPVKKTTRSTRRPPR
jgi:hypothetical protein